MGETSQQRGEGGHPCREQGMERKVSNVKLLFCHKLVYNISFAFATRGALAGFEGEPSEGTKTILALCLFG